MNITVVGMGNIGTAIGADLTIQGHKVTLVKSSKNYYSNHHKYLLEKKLVKIIEYGIEKNVKIHKVTDDFSEAFINVDLIIICIQTNYHKGLIEKISPYLSFGQTILFEPGYLSTAYMLQSNFEKELTILEAESSPIDCRITKPGEIEVLFRNIRNPIGVFPSIKTEYAHTLLKELDYGFITNNSVIESALHNPNLIVHTVGAIMSLPRIEYTNGEYWMYKEVFTPSVWNIVEKLDSEKNNILEKLGFNKVSYVDACRFRNSKDLTIDSKKVFFEYAFNSSPKGPSDPRSRFITEDVPEGLVLMESLGGTLNVETPVCSSLIELASAALNLDFRESGRSLEKLGIDNLNRIINDKTKESEVKKWM